MSKKLINGIIDFVKKDESLADCFGIYFFNLLNSILKAGDLILASEYWCMKRVFRSVNE